MNDGVPFEKKVSLERSVNVDSTYRPGGKLTRGIFLSTWFSSGTVIEIDQETG